MFACTKVKIKVNLPYSVQGHVFSPSPSILPLPWHLILSPKYTEKRSNLSGMDILSRHASLSKLFCLPSEKGLL